MCLCSNLQYLIIWLLYDSICHYVKLSLNPFFAKIAYQN